MAAHQPRITIIDYGVGNTYSVLNAVQALGYKKLKVSADEKEIINSDALILPGVGAFANCVANLRTLHLDTILHDAVFGRGIPILGICVGMQLMATISEEKGTHKGLNWIPGRVVALDPSCRKAVPHVGWNDLIIDKKSELFCPTSVKSNFYFDHSYEYVCDVAENAIAYCDYGEPVVAAVSSNKIFGVQFHPEKSQLAGLKLFRSFFSMVSEC